MKMTLEQRMRRAMKKEVRDTNAALPPRRAAAIAADQGCRFYERKLPRELADSEAEHARTVGASIMNEVNAELARPN